MTAPAPAIFETKHDLSGRAQHDLLVIEAALAGNQKAYAELLKSYRKSVTYIVLKIVSNVDDANDLALEVFTKAFRYLPNYRPDYAFSTWLFRIATNHSIDFIRRQKLQTQSLSYGVQLKEGECLPLDVRDPALNPQEAYIRQQRIDIVQRLTNTLPLKYARPVRLRYLQQLSYAEMATELKLPVGTVKARLFRARGMLRALLANSRAAL